ncbi:hypothetical protein SAMN05216326_12520 [Nitrosomonas marina]|uniref:Ribosome modulation factor n=1 Tax=Nitrosomonas marina TaxID=917 RepID=A0A1I0E6H0_9PROT|nr:cell division protein FtsK [Nitrosomonas marina]SET40423.1 hypothetical protein SAMN05216326_12520 [Nitrosomonas marina]
MSETDFRKITAETAGRDLLEALVQEIRLMPDVWQKMAKKKQDDVIERLRSRVEENIKMVVHVLSAQGRIVVVGDLEQITIKDGVKAVIRFGTNASNLHELYDANGKSVMVVVADAADHTGGMDEIQGENDQRAFDLGHEYHDNDGGGMGDDETIDSSATRLPSPDDVKPTTEELNKAFEDGYQAASEGKPQSDCPVVRSELVVEWIRGHKAWHEENADEEVTEQ